MRKILLFALLMAVVMMVSCTKTSTKQDHQDQETTVDTLVCTTQSGDTLKYLCIKFPGEKRQEAEYDIVTDTILCTTQNGDTIATGVHIKLFCGEKQLKESIAINGKIIPIAN